MSPTIDPVDARRYLLGEASDDECGVIEKEYIGRPEALEALEAAEEALIEDYLDGQLGAQECERFERHYLATPHHRTRVETVRRLKQASPPIAAPIPIAAGRPRPVTMSRARMFQTLALAAMFVIAVGASLWFWRNREVTGSGAPTVATATPPGPPDATTRPAPRVFAMAISPVAVRSAAESPTLVIPAGTDVLDLRFEGDAGDKPVARGRVAVRTVNGDDVWQGPSAAAQGLAAGVIAHAEIPTARLRVDDYIVTLFEIGPTGVESERHRYSCAFARGKRLRLRVKLRRTTVALAQVVVRPAGSSAG